MPGALGGPPSSAPTAGGAAPRRGVSVSADLPRGPFLLRGRPESRLTGGGPAPGPQRRG